MGDGGGVTCYLTVPTVHSLRRRRCGVDDDGHFVLVFRKVGDNNHNSPLL